MGKTETVFRSDRLRLLQGKRTQQELADLIGINQSQLQRYLSGRSEPTAAVVARMARRLSVSADYLLGLVDRPSEMIAELSRDELALLDVIKNGVSFEAIQALMAFLKGADD